jgi:Zn-dependent metallo-hydrolase RNA specificity domain
LKPSQTILVHGDAQAMRRFAERLSSTEVSMSRKGDEARL